MTLSSFKYVARETANSLKRNPWLSLASIATVMVSLLILGFSAFFMANATNTARNFESQLEIGVFVHTNATTLQIQDLQNQIKNMPGVASVTLVTKEQALADFGKSMGGSNSSLITDLGGTNPFPDKLTVKATNPQLVKQLSQQIQGLSNVDKVNYGQGIVDRVLEFTSWLRWIGAVIIVAFAVASIVLISINTKMNVFSRRREIQIMKLVGASNSFIRWPFLVEGLSLGFVGGLLASVFVGFGYQWMAEYVRTTLSFLPVVQNPSLFWEILIGLLISGMGIGALGSVVSLRKFLKV